MAGVPWTDDEISSTIDIYFRMLTLELAGEVYSKAEFRRELAHMVSRSPSALDYKFNNVSAALDEVGAVWISGYRPLRNIQGRLREMVHERFSRESDLRAFMLRAVEDQSTSNAALGPETAPPSVDWPRVDRPRRGTLGVDYVAIEASNRKLGKAGEEAVISAERARLVRGGRQDLAAEVRHVGQIDGDGLGYDVQSFQGLTDEPIYIEVKTTRYDKEIPFYLTRTELEASDDYGPNFRLFRLYLFGRADSAHYVLPGPLSANAQLRVEAYRALPSENIPGEVREETG